MRIIDTPDTEYRYWDDSLGTWVYKFQKTLPSGYPGWMIKAQPHVKKHYTGQSGKPGGLLTYTDDGSLTKETKQRLNDAWNIWEHRDKLSQFGDLPKDRDHYTVWRYLTLDNGKGLSVEQAYDLYKQDRASKAMSYATFARYSETIPPGSKYWQWRPSKSFVEDHDGAIEYNVTGHDDSGVSAWAEALPNYFVDLTPAEQRAVDAFYSGEEVSGSYHPQYKSFQRAKAKLKDLLVTDGYPVGQRKRLRSSIEGNGGRSTATSSRITLPKA